MLAGGAQLRGSNARLTALALVCMLGMVSSSAAQRAFDPQQIEKKVEASEAERRRNQQRGVALPGRPAATAGIEDKTPLFKLTSVTIEGAKSLPLADLKFSYGKYIGKTVSRSDLASITDKINELYRAAGYHLSRAIVPPQGTTDGALRIRVIEGRITDLVFKGSDHFGTRNLLQSVSNESPSRLETLERQLLLVSSQPGVLITDTGLEEIGKTSGKFRLIVHLETWRVFNSAEIDNRGTRAIGPAQAYWGTALNSAFVSGDTLGINLSAVPDSSAELGFGRIFYDAPIDASGSRFGISAAYSEAWPGDERRRFKTDIATEHYEAKGTVAVLQSLKSSLWLTASAGILNVTEREAGGTNYEDRIRTIGLTANYQLKDSTDAWNYLTVSLRQGVGVFGASGENDSLLSRNDGSGTFTKLEFLYSRYQQLSDAWSVKLAAAGQIASRALLASQEFYLGGIGFGRGYDSGELSGENALAALLEVRFDQAVEAIYIKKCQLYGFIDGGAVWDFGFPHSERRSLTSAGMGVRIYMPYDMLAGVEFAAPLDGEGLNPRAFFSLTQSYKF